VQLVPDHSSIQSILNRPLSERIREYKYRFAQCLVFGLPVLALHFFGPKLGGAEAGRWAGLLGALLSGWCLYVGALAMVSEGAMLLAFGKMRFELLLGIVVVVFYVVGVVGWIFTLRGRSAPIGSAFSVVVVILVLWSGVQWIWLRAVAR